MRLERLEAGNYICPDDPGEQGHQGQWQRRSVTDEEAGILRELARGQYVLEIGTGLGVATRAMAETAKRILTIDSDPWVEDPGVKNVVFLRQREGIGRRVSDDWLAFVDGSHVYDAVRSDLQWLRYLGVEVIAMHDTYIDDVRTAMEAERVRVVLRWPTACHLALCTL